MRSFALTCQALLLATCTAWPAAAAAQNAAFDVPARDLGGALMTLARQANREIYFSAELTRNLTAPALRGRLSLEEALSRLLAGTGLRYRITPSGAIVIERAARGADASDPPEADGGAEIVVTGTNIRGVVPESSPLTVLNRRELDARGAVTAEQAVNSFTQNFNSVNANATAADRAGYYNDWGISGIDLRGLGPGTTLVLINGRRLAGSANGRAVDISQIPLAAVSRVELLTDSASSVYGSDAVGGVVNFVLLDRFSGIEARSAYGMTDDGALDEYRASLTGGLNWGTGNAVVSASYLNRSALTTDERSFSEGVGGRYTLSTPQERAGLFATARQELGDRLTLTADGLFNRRVSAFDLYRDLGLIGGRPYLNRYHYDQEADSWFGALGATWRAGDALTVDLAGSYSRAANSYVLDFQSTLAGAQTQTYDTTTQTWDVTARASGRLLPLPGGDLAYSVGAGWTGENLDNALRTSSRPTVTRRALERETRYAFAELNVPLIGAANGIKGVHRFELNLSARYSDYSDFGEDFSPKLGVLWAVTLGFNLRASYGRTFRAPYLTDLGVIGFYQINNPLLFGFPNPTSDPRPVGLYIDDGTDPDLGPETSNLLALGLDLRPPAIPRFTFSLTYVSIDYNNRIARGDPARGAGFYLQPQLYGDLFNFSPTREDFARLLASSQLGSGSNVTGFNLGNLDEIVANVDFILDNRLRNIAQSRQRAVDITTSYGFTRGSIDYSVGANATFILESNARTTPSSSSISQINTLGRPVDFRANAYLGLSSGGFATRLTGLYVGSYSNPYVAAFPKIDDWLTFDLTASYDFGDRPGLLGGLAVYLSVQNLLDSDPPFAADIGAGVTDGLSEPIGYDPANSNPLGRFVSIELRKRF